MQGHKSFTQTSLSGELDVSIGMVNKSVSKLKRFGAVRTGPRNFTVIDYRRILLYWATIRNLERDVAYSTRVNLPVVEIERSLPDGVIFSAYTGTGLSFSEFPADYSEVWVYASEPLLVELERRFRKNNLPRNFIVLREDAKLQHSVRLFSKHPKSVSVPQLYVDLWNTPTWYSKEFQGLIERKMEESARGILEQ